MNWTGGQVRERLRLRVDAAVQSGQGCRVIVGAAEDGDLCAERCVEFSPEVMGPEVMGPEVERTEGEASSEAREADEVAGVRVGVRVAEADAGEEVAETDTREEVAEDAAAELAEDSTAEVALLPEAAEPRSVAWGARPVDVAVEREREAGTRPPADPDVRSSELPDCDCRLSAFQKPAREPSAREEARGRRTRKGWTWNIWAVAWEPIGCDGCG